MTTCCKSFINSIAPSCCPWFDHIIISVCTIAKRPLVRLFAVAEPNFLVFIQHESYRPQLYAKEGTFVGTITKGLQEMLIKIMNTSLVI